LTEAMDRRVGECFGRGRYHSALVPFQGCRKNEELAGSVEKRGDGDPGGVHGVVGILLLAPAIPAPVAVLGGEERARSAANEIVVPLRAAGAAERIHDL